MPTKRRKPTPKADRETPQTRERRAVRQQLQRALRTEKDIQTLTRRLNSEIQRTNDRLQTLALALSSRARALEAERDVDRSLAVATRP